jgi:hypothetical protein
MASWDISSTSACFKASSRLAHGVTWATRRYSPRPRRVRRSIGQEESGSFSLIFDQ